MAKKELDIEVHTNNYRRQAKLLVDLEKEIKRIVIDDLNKGVAENDFELLKETVEKIPFNFLWLIPYLKKMKELNNDC